MSATLEEARTAISECEGKMSGAVKELVEALEGTGIMIEEATLEITTEHRHHPVSGPPSQTLTIYAHVTTSFR